MNRLALLFSCLALFACPKKNDATPDAGDKAAAPAAGAAGVGLNAPGNDPKIVALAKKVLGCKWSSGSFDGECPDYKAWKAEHDAFSDNKVDGTLVAFIEDSDEKVRNLGEDRLYGWGQGAFADKALAARLVTVAEKNKSSDEMYKLGNIVGHIKVQETGLFPRIKALVASSATDSTLRGSIISSLLNINPDSDEVFALTRDTVKDADKQVARNALRAFWVGASDKTHAARCDVYAQTMDNPDDDLAGGAAEYLTRPQAGCKSHFDALLKSLEARMKAKKLTVSTFVEALGGVCEGKSASPAQVKKTIGLAHKIAEDKTAKGFARAAAIEASVTCDPKGAKAYLGKFKKDADKEVQEKVAKLSAAPKK